MALHRLASLRRWDEGSTVRVQGERCFPAREAIQLRTGDDEKRAPAD